MPLQDTATRLREWVGNPGTFWRFPGAVGRQRHPHLSAWCQHPPRAVRKRQAKCDCHSWAPAPVWSQHSCAPCSPQPSCGRAGSQHHHGGKVCVPALNRHCASSPGALRAAWSSPSEGVRYLVQIFLLLPGRK